jgi:hypothetical protein
MPADQKHARHIFIGEERRDGLARQTPVCHYGSAHAAHVRACVCSCVCLYLHLCLCVYVLCIECWHVLEAHKPNRLVVIGDFVR